MENEAARLEAKLKMEKEVTRLEAKEVALLRDWQRQANTSLSMEDIQWCGRIELMIRFNRSSTLF